MERARRYPGAPRLPRGPRPRPPDRSPGRAGGQGGRAERPSPHPAPPGRHRAFLIADKVGARRLTLVEDVDGLYTADPNDPRGATPEFIPEISASELAAGPATLPVDRMLLEVMAVAKHLDRIQIVNGLKPDNVLRALRGEHVGTVIHSA